MVSPSMRAQLQRVTDPAGVLVLLTLSHPSIETVYVVNDTRSWTIAGTVYVALPFRFKLPNSTAGEAPRAQIELDNVGRDLTDELEKLPAGGALLATFRLVSRNAPTVVEYEFQAPLSGVVATTQVVTATVGNDDAYRAPAVKMRYDPSNSPGLFAG